MGSNESINVSAFFPSQSPHCLLHCRSLVLRRALSLVPSARDMASSDRSLGCSCLLPTSSFASLAARLNAVHQSRQTHWRCRGHAGSSAPRRRCCSRPFACCPARPYSAIADATLRYRIGLYESRQALKYTHSFPSRRTSPSPSSCALGGSPPSKRVQSFLYMHTMLVVAAGSCNKTQRVYVQLGIPNDPCQLLCPKHELANPKLLWT